MELNPYLNFNGQCREAMEYYARVLGGTITAMITFGDMPGGEQCSPEMSSGIMHAAIDLGGSKLLASDCPPEMYEPPKGISVAVHPTDPAEAERIFNALAEGGTVTMPVQETFWALRFGMCVDRYGIAWMVNCAKAE